MLYTLLKMNNIFLWTLITVVASVKLPSYIKPCPRDPKVFNQCALESAKQALPYLAEGDPQFYLPSLRPLHIHKIDVSPENNFIMELMDIDIYGLETTKIKSVSVDFDKQRGTVDLDIDTLSIIGTYFINGRILILPIQGHGNANITLFGGNYKYYFQWDYVFKSNVRYARITKSFVRFTLQNVHYQLDNLFNGDKKLGVQMNKFLNENWREVHKDLNKPVGKAITDICDRICKNVYTRVPYDDLFSK